MLAGVGGGLPALGGPELRNSDVFRDRQIFGKAQNPGSMDCVVSAETLDSA